MSLISVNLSRLFICAFLSTVILSCSGSNTANVGSTNTTTSDTGTQDDDSGSNSDAGNDSGSDTGNPVGSQPCGNGLGLWPISNSCTPDCVQDPFGHRLLGSRDDFHPGFDTCEDDLNEINDTDFEDAGGLDIHAPFNGEITEVRLWDPDWSENSSNCPNFCRQGNYIMMRVPELESRFSGEVVQFIFMHMKQNSVTVTEGQQVEAGDVLGKVGKTGNNINTVHLHMGLLVGPDPGRIDSDFYINPLVAFPYTASSTHDLALSRISDTDIFDNNECFSATNTLKLELTQERDSIDVVQIEVTPPSGSSVLVNFNERIGINMDNVDDFQHQCVAFEVENFNKSYETYQLEVYFGGNWGSGSYQIELTTVRGDTQQRSIQVN